MTAQDEHHDPVVLSVIVANWDTRELLRNLLVSIESHRPPLAFEVIFGISVMISVAMGLLMWKKKIF